MLTAITLTIPLRPGWERRRRIRRAVVVLACCVGMLSGSGPYPVGAQVRSWGVVGNVVRWSYGGREYTATAETLEGALTLDAVLWRVGQGRPGYVYASMEEASGAADATPRWGDERQDRR